MTKSSPRVLSSVPDCLKGGNLIRLPAGARLFQTGDDCTQFFYLIDGKIRVDLIAKGGRAIMLYRFGADEPCILTMSCLLSGDKYCAEAHTETEVKAYVVPLSSFEEQMNSSEDFRRLVFSSFSARLSSMMGKIEEIAAVSIDARLASRLLEMRSSHPMIHVTHEQLAVDLGTAREVVSRRLAQWEKNGLIKRARGSLRLLNIGQIESMAKLSD